MTRSRASARSQNAVGKNEHDRTGRSGLRWGRYDTRSEVRVAAGANKQMKTFRVILTAAVLLAALLSPAAVRPAERYVCEAAALTPQARAELAAMTRATAHGSALWVEPDAADALADWAARHGLPLPSDGPRTAFSAAEAVVADNNAHRPTTGETLAAVLPHDANAAPTTPRTALADWPAGPALQPVKSPAAPRGPPQAC